MSTITFQGPTVVSELSQTTARRWRKQILPLGAIEYAGRKLEFTAKYFNDIVDSFSREAYDTVPFVLADESNRHTMAPERAGGTVVGLSAEADGLYADIELNERAADLIREQPKLGVSVRVLENLTRPDGKSFKAALQHVLGTFDPKVNGMKPWSAVELSHRVEVAEGVHIDYSTTVVETHSTEKGENMPDVRPEGTAPFLTKDQIDKLEELSDEDLQTIANMVGGAGSTEDEPAEGESTEDEGEDAVTEEPVLVAASNTGGDAVELANAQLAEQRREIMVMRQELDAKNYDAEKAELVRAGIPPAVVDLAKPLLFGSNHVIELSNPTGDAEKVDAGAVLRDVLKEYAKQAKLVDLSEPVGFATDTTGGQSGDEDRLRSERDEFVKQHTELFRL